MLLKILGIIVFVVVAAGLWGWLHLRKMTTKRKKAFVKTTLNSVFVWAEDKGLMKRTPAIDYDYLTHYPDLKIFEDHYDEIRAECLAMLNRQDRLVDISVMGGAYTKAGIHTIDWKTVMFKAGDFVEENCEKCPKTAELLRQTPGIFTAFFSVIQPHQYVTPHWGYWKGFVRYHLGVVIPDNNENKLCWIRVNGNAEQNAKRDIAYIEQGEVYHWKNGEGILFDDNYLHDAANESDETRVVMWLDVRRKMPFYLDAYNRLCLALMRRDESMKKIQRNAVIAG